MRVLVTGAAGFLGSRVATGLLEDGHEVVAVLRESSKADMLDSRVVQVRHDGSTDHLIRLVVDARPQSAIHVASLFVAEHKPNDIEPLISYNLTFGCQLLEALAAAGVDRLVNFGTSWQHFDGGQIDRYRPATLYAATGLHNSVMSMTGTRVVAFNWANHLQQRIADCWGQVLSILQPTYGILRVSVHDRDVDPAYHISEEDLIRTLDVIGE